MAISRMQEPRQLYGLGSLVKSIGKGVKKLIKSPVGKGLLLAGGFGLAGMGPFAGLGKTALGTKLFGVPGVPDAIGKEGILSGLISKFKGAGTGTKLGIGGSLVSLLLADGFSGDEVKAITQDKEAVARYLKDYYTKLNPDASEDDVAEFVETNTIEYKADGGRMGYAEGSRRSKYDSTGGGLASSSKSKDISRGPGGGGRDDRIQLAELSKKQLNFLNQPITQKSLRDSSFGLTPKQIFDKLPSYEEKPFFSPNQEPTTEDEFNEYLKSIGVTQMVADGGRIGLKDGPKKYMFNDVLREPMSELERVSVGNPGTKEMYESEILEMLAQNRDQGRIKRPRKKQKSLNIDIEKIKQLIQNKVKGLAAGGMPTGVMRTNQAGVMERDYRDEGGFVPVGIKERADDVPAMLSKNEFVMTADAVRGAGNGSIEKGAQKMYDQMKNLEKRVV